LGLKVGFTQKKQPKVQGSIYKDLGMSSPP